MGGPRPGDTAELVGLRSRPDLNGRRVEGKGRSRGQDGAPRLAVLLLSEGGEWIKVKSSNVKRDRPRRAPEPEPGDPAELVGLRSRLANLNGRRVEVEGLAVGRDGLPEFNRYVVRVLGDEGEPFKVKAANLKLFGPG